MSRKDVEAEVRVGWRMAGLAFEVSSMVLGGAALGWLCDRWFESAPTGVLVGSLLGIVVGLWDLIRGGLKLNRELDRRHPTLGRATPLPPDPEPTDDDDPGNPDDPR